MKFINSRTGLVGAGLAVVVLAGGSTSAIAHGYGPSIGGEDIRNESIYSQDIKNGQVKTGELKDGGVELVDISQSARNSLRGQGRTGLQGPKGEPGTNGEAGEDSTVAGPQGIQGEKGADGQNGVSGFEPHNREVRWSSAAGETVVSCPEGKVALGGGFVVEGIRGGSAVVSESQPVYADGTTTGWVVRGVATGEANVKSWVTCAAVL